MIPVVCVLCIICTAGSTPVSSTPPNIVLFMADDLGYGDIGRFGNTTLRTPNIDKIGEDGATFTQHVAAGSLCTPSRSAFLTGRYPIRSGMASPSDERVIMFVASSAGLPQTEVTFGKLVKTAGYRTGLIGKWHLGLNCRISGDHCHHPNNHGFDFFYGLPLTNMVDFGDDSERIFLQLYPNLDTKCLTACAVGLLFCLILRYLNFIGTKLSIVLLLLLELPFLLTLFLIFNMRTIDGILMRQGETVEQPINLKSITPRFIQESTEFIESAHRDGVPFLLFVSWTHVHTALVTMDDFTGVSKHGRYGDAVEEMDWAIGEIVKFLDSKGLTDNTVVYFTSDHGGRPEERGKHGDVQGGSNGIYRDGKAYAISDGGVRVPAVMKWPGRIAPGTFIDRATSLMDIFPTIAAISGAAMPRDRPYDGRDLTPLLTGKSDAEHHEFLFHYCCTEIHAVRYMPRGTKEVYKLVYREQHNCSLACFCSRATRLSPPRLRSLHDDPSERHYVEISPGSKYGDIISIMDAAKRRHERNLTHIDDPQMTFGKLLWRPWLQPCCNFPLCRCHDEKYPT